MATTGGLLYKEEGVYSPCIYSFEVSISLSSCLLLGKRVRSEQREEEIKCSVIHLVTVTECAHVMWYINQSNAGCVRVRFITVWMTNGAALNMNKKPF